MSVPLSPHDLVYGLKMAGEPAISPDGARVVYTLTSASPETGKSTTHLWEVPASGGDPRQLTSAGTANTWPRWSPSGDALAFVSDRVERSGLFILPVSGGGEPREVARMGTAISGVAWSPDGTRIAFVAPVDPAPVQLPGGAPPVRATKRIDYKQDGFGYLGETRRQVFVVGAAGGTPRQLTCAPFDHSLPAWSPDGARLAFNRATNNGMTSQVGVVGLEDGEVRDLVPDGWVCGTWAWTPGGESILLSGEPSPTAQPDFYLVDAATGERQRLTDDLPCLPDGGFPPLLPPSQPVFLDAQHAIFHAFHHGRSGIWVLDIEDGAVLEVEAEDELRTNFSVDAAHRTAVQIASSPGAAGEVVAVDLREGQRRYLTSHNGAQFAATPPCELERIEIERDGLVVEAWVLLPPGLDRSRRHPFVLDVHGGPQAHYGYGFVTWQQVLASNGIPVVFSNPRGSTSYGRDFVSRVKGDWGGGDYEDLMAVVDAAAALPYLDGDRAGIWGYSYGGYMTAYTIGRNHRFKAAVCGAPCFDLESMFGTSDISHFFGAMHWTGTPWDEPGWYAARSPSARAHETQTPTLIIHGEADERCPIGQGEQMFVTLLKAGCETEFVRYPGGYHGFLRAGPPPHREDVLSRLLAWFQARL
ncbi:MAG: S9 family peptidase [Dehalococcoidia bacterium]